MILLVLIICSFLYCLFENPYLLDADEILDSLSADPGLEAATDRLKVFGILALGDV